MEKIKLLLYCTKGKPTLYNVLGKYITYKYLGKDFMQDGKTHPELNGKIVAECDFEVEHLYNAYDVNNNNFTHYFDTDTLKEVDLIKRCCLSKVELTNYFKYENGYAIHIKNLNIFDKPRELRSYETQEIWNNTSHYHRTIMKAPQNMMRCYGINTGDKYILISIRAEWLCKILNKEKTIEVRKKVLKEMINNA